jgi:hypothetical protein
VTIFGKSAFAMPFSILNLAFVDTTIRVVVDAYSSFLTFSKIAMVLFSVYLNILAPAMVLVIIKISAVLPPVIVEKLAISFEF